MTGSNAKILLHDVHSISARKTPVSGGTLWPRPLAAGAAPAASRLWNSHEAPMRIVMRMKAIALSFLMAVSASPACAETESEFREATRELENVELGGLFKVEPYAYACADKGKLMFVERMLTGDAVDQSTAELIGARDCEGADEGAIYSRCEAGGFVFPKPGGRKIFSGYCVKGTKEPVLYIRDDQVRRVDD